MLDVVEELFQQGVELHKSGKVEVACQLYTAVLKAHPEHPTANHNMGVLAVDVGKVQEALPFFEAALEANADTAQFWLSYIDALINVERIADAQAVFDQAKNNGAQGDGFDQLERRLNVPNQAPLEASNTALEGYQDQPNILETLKLDQALRLAKKTAKEGSLGDAKRIYQDVLVKFPKNKRAIDGIKALAGVPVGKASEVQDPPQGQLQSLINLYTGGELHKALDGVDQLLQQFPNSITLFNIQGASNAGLGRLDAAIAAYNSALAIKPDYAEAYNNMGAALRVQGKLEEAIEAYTKALAIKPDFAEAYSNIGVSLKEQGKLEEAIGAFNKALAIKPDFADAFYKVGVTFKEQGKLEEAIVAFNKALVLKPDYADAYSDMGTALQPQGKLEEAIEAYTKALSIKPDYVEAYYNIGTALKEQGKLEEAIEAFNKALSIKPDYAAAYNNMGATLQEQGKLEEAIEAYTEALSIKSDYAEAYNNLGNVLQENDNLNEAIEAFNKALAIKPDYAEVYSNMGNVLKEQGNLDEAIEAFNKALAIKPDYAEGHKNLSFALLNNGRLSEGLDEYEWRWKTSKFLRSKRLFSQPLWDGKTSLKGKRILVWCEQGVGDTVMWSSRLSLLASQAGHCILECQEKLIPLLSRSFPNVEVKSEDRSRDTKRDDFDFHLPMGSLYRHFITEITQNPRPDAFLIPDPVRIKFWKDRLSSLGSGPWVGISWQSSLMGGERRKHFSSISEWSSLLTLPNIAFINLQYADAADGLLQIQNEFGVKVHNFDDLDQYNNLDDVAALSAALDCVVSFGTSVPMITAGVGTSTKCALLASNTKGILGGPEGPLVDKFEKNTWEPWSSVFNDIAKDIAKL